MANESYLPVAVISLLSVRVIFHGRLTNSKFESEKERSVVSVPCRRRDGEREYDDDGVRVSGIIIIIPRDRNVLETGGG